MGLCVANIFWKLNCATLLERLKKVYNSSKTYEIYSEVKNKNSSW